jgi:hypothetical protein
VEIVSAAAVAAAAAAAVEEEERVGGVEMAAAEESEEEAGEEGVSSSAGACAEAAYGHSPSRRASVALFGANMRWASSTGAGERDHAPSCMWPCGGTITDAANYSGAAPNLSICGGPSHRLAFVPLA